MVTKSISRPFLSGMNNRAIKTPLKKKRPGATPQQLQIALKLVFLGHDGAKISVRQAALRVDGVSRSPLQRAVANMVEKLRKMGIRGYDAPQKGRALDLPLPEEGSKERDQVEKAISLYIPPPNMGRWAGYLTPDEENFLVDIVEMRDFYGFGMDRGELQLMAQRWCKRGGFKGVLCGKNWFRGFMRRAKQ